MLYGFGALVLKPEFGKEGAMMWNAWPPVSFAFDEGEGEGENGDFDGGAGSSVNE